MIRKAKFVDIENIMIIVKQTIIIMHSEGNYQWDDKYPTREMLLQDIEGHNLFVYETEGEVVAFICVNFNVPEEYNGIKWGYDIKASSLHRTAVSQGYRHKGIASSLIRYAEEVTISRNCLYIKADTFSGNEKMNNLFNRLQYRKTGQIEYEGYPGKYNCYEKYLGNI